MPVKPIEKQADVGVIVGRFQVHDLHPGHTELLDYVFERHNKVIIVLGVSAVPGTRNNPLDVEARSYLIKGRYPKAIIGHIKDCRCDEEWSNKLDTLISELKGPSQSILLYGSRDSFLPYYSGTYETQELVSDGAFWSGTEIRNKIKNEIDPTISFRAGAIWETYQQYPKVYPTVDIAVTRLEQDKVNLLLVRKPSEKQWRLPGGFVDTRDKNLEAAARREMIEECGAIETGPMKYIGSMLVDDWRYRSEIDKIMTNLFHTELKFGAVKAGDDVCEYCWKSLDCSGDWVVSEHKKLIEMLQDVSK